LSKIEDPLVCAIADVVEMVFQRGIEVKPQGDGWFIRLANGSSEATEIARIGRSW
jgi:hypothetical protein